MSFNKKFFTTGGIVASAPPAAAGLDPLQNFETVTYTGNGSTQKITGYIRKGAAFNGSSSYITTPSFFSNPNTNSSTFSAWFNTSINDSNLRAIAANRNGGAGYIAYDIYTQNGVLVLAHQYLGGGGASSITGTTNIADGDWHNVIVVLDNSNGTLKMYLDGSQEGTTYSFTSGQNLTQFANTLYIGKTFFNERYWNGKIDQVRIFNTALNSTQVGQLALETYADPKKSTTDYFGDGSGVALYELDEDANSSNFEQAAVFNGSSSYISGLNGVIPATTTDCTFSCWFNMSTGFSSNFKSILGGTGVDSLRITINYSSSGNYKIQPGRGISSNAFYSSSNWSATAILPNLWYHLVCVYTNSSNTMDVYLNNNLIDSEVLSTTTSSAVNTNLVLGYYRSDVGFSYWNGSIDQVRIYSSALGTGDVEKLYKESADVPTANLVAHYKLDGNAEDVLDTYDGTTSNVTYSTGVYGGTPTNVNFLGMAFQPDLVWIKERTSTSGHFLSDSVRGATKVIYSNLTNEEDTETTVLTSFDTNGFSVGSSGGVNAGTDNYVAWCWKAGGVPTPNNNTQGTTPSTVSANQDAGFSIVKFPVTNTSVNVGHGLLAPPEMIIYKNLTYPDNWYVYHKDLSSPNTQYLNLNLFSVATTNATYNFSSVTSTTFTSYLAGGGDAVCYCFHSVDEYQKVGSYSGDSSTVTVTTGFEPRFVMIKRTNTTSADWILYDQVRSGGTDMDDYMTPNSALVEQQNSAIDITAIPTGFTVESGNWQGVNILGGEYIYLAIA